MRAPQNTRLRPIHLAFPSSSPYPRQRRNGEDVLSPQTGALLPSQSFSSPLFFPSPFKPLFYSILPPRSSCCALSALLSPLQRLFFSAISISLPRAQRQFSRSSPEPFSSPFSPPLSLSLTFSHTRLTLILIFTYQDGSIRFRRVNERGVNKKSQQGGKLRGAREEERCRLRHTCFAIICISQIIRFRNSQNGGRQRARRDHGGNKLLSVGSKPEAAIYKLNKPSFASL